MALLPKNHHRKTRLFAPSRPNYSDFNSPPDGDYVRYVEDLMAWAEHEQQRQRLHALGEKSALQSSEQEWGRTPAAPALKPSSTAVPTTEPGSVEGAVARFQRKAQQLQQKAQAQGTSKGKPQASSLGWVLLIPMLVVAGIFAPDLLPVVIVLWVVFSVIQSVRKASQSNKR